MVKVPFKKRKPRTFVKATVGAFDLEKQANTFFEGSLTLERVEAERDHLFEAQVDTFAQATSMAEFMLAKFLAGLREPVWKKKWLWVIVVLIVLVVGYFLFAGGR